MRCTAYQKYHKKHLPVTHIMIDKDGLYSVTVDYGDKTTPRFVTYSKDSKNYWLFDENGCVLELSFEKVKYVDLYREIFLKDEN